MLKSKQTRGQYGRRSEVPKGPRKIGGGYGTRKAQVELERRVGQFAAFSNKAMVVVRSAADSPHAFLVQALDICNKHQMTNLSIFSK